MSEENIGIHTLLVYYWKKELSRRATAQEIYEVESENVHTSGQ